MANRLPALSQRLQEFARRTATAVQLEELYHLGLAGDIASRLKVASFLKQEIAIRNAQLCQELRLLPFGLAETRGVGSVMSWFGNYVDWLASCPEPQSAEEEHRFTELLKKILEDNSNVVSTMGSAVLEVRAAMGEEQYEEVRSEVDLILDRFFIKRIGLRFLIQHHIESAFPRPGVSGIISSNVALGPLLRRSAEEAREQCQIMCGLSPRIEVVGDGDLDAFNGPDLSHKRQFTYVPIHLQFVCLELLRNACQAVARHHRGKRRGAVELDALPPVRATFAHGEEEVTLRVSDQGGGIPRSELHLAWSYFDRPRSNEVESSFDRQQGLQVGLPLARLHARYYGGDIVLKSMEGFGTDAYVFLNRLGNCCEKLPPGVRVSPSQRDSSVGDAASFSLDSLGAASDAEVAFLNKRLSEHRAMHSTGTIDDRFSSAGSAV